MSIASVKLSQDMACFSKYDGLRHPFEVEQNIGIALLQIRNNANFWSVKCGILRTNTLYSEIAKIKRIDRRSKYVEQSESKIDSI